MATGPCQITTLTPVHSGWPSNLTDRLGRDAPRSLQTIGNLEILAVHKVGLFCSVRCPGDKILAAYHNARRLRDDGVAVISGFHSPVEKECLRILLRGKQPIIICLARAMEKIRLPMDWRGALDADRLLVLSPFEKRPRRPTVESSYQRNELVAALCKEALIVHAEPGGSVARISELIRDWKIPSRPLM